jgi:two-component system response regulator FlrC
MSQGEASILVVDDDAGMRLGMVETLRRAGYQVVQAADGSEGLARLERENCQVVVTDMRMPRMSGLEFLKQIKMNHPATEVLVVTAYGTIQNAIEAIKCGAFDYLLKPFSPQDLTLAVETAITKGTPSHLAKGGGSTSFVSKSPVVQEMLQLARRAAASDATILIQAESGTGKELLARYIVEQSPRAQKPVVAINCAALPDNLLESELFGYEKGSFTGALNAKPGKFELADGGTLLLDEIGEMPLPLQPKLLRALQEGEVDRIGSRTPRKVEFRLIALTNRKLQQRVAEGSFREDLFFRLNVIPLEIPPLRTRPEDLDVLIPHFLARFGRPKAVLSAEALRLLKRYPWPGNVRELENLLQRAVVLGAGEVIEPQDLYLSTTSLASSGEEALRHGQANQAASSSSLHLQAGQTVGEMERRLIELTLEETSGNRTHAARMLGISLRTLRNKLQEYRVVK